MNPDEPRFELDAFAIFKCAKTGEDLEAAAFLALGKSWLRVADARAQAANQMLARSRLPAVEHAVFAIEVRVHAASRTVRSSTMRYVSMGRSCLRLRICSWPMSAEPT